MTPPLSSRILRPKPLLIRADEDSAGSSCINLRIPVIAAVVEDGLKIFSATLAVVSYGIGQFWFWPMIRRKSFALILSIDSSKLGKRKNY